MKVSVSVVTYRPDYTLLAKTLETLADAVAHVRASGREIESTVWVVDNSGDLRSGDWSAALARAHVGLEIISGHGNIGYGRGNNLAIERASSEYHLVLNPDVEMAPDALSIAIRFLETHRDFALVAPHVEGPDGQKQYLCRRFPAVLDLLIRGALPQRMRAMFDHRLARYEMRAEIDAADREADPREANVHPLIVSGCFMFYRTATLQSLGGFDPRYFLYFEDYDLSIRTSRTAKIAYLPALRIVHAGGGAALKGWTHIRLFGTSAFRFFSRFGWRWC